MEDINWIDKIDEEEYRQKIVDQINNYYFKYDLPKDKLYADIILIVAGEWQL